MTRLQENIFRVTALGDVMGTTKSFDGKRVRYIKNALAQFMDKNEVFNGRNLSSCLRPCTPDDLPIVGPLRLYPNVYLNAGHGGRGTTVGLATSKIVEEMVENG